MIDLQNDGAHSVANTATINGTYNAQGGGALAVDAQLGAAGSVADRLTVNGAATGGTTLVSVRNAIGGVGALNVAGITVARINGANAGGGFALNPSSPGFTLAGGVPVIDAGLYAYSLEQGGGVGCDGATVCYSLYSGPSQRAQTLPVAAAATQALWRETALMWEDRQTELRDAASPAQGLTTWIKPLGAWSSHKKEATSRIGSRSVSFDLGYSQNSFGMVGGSNYAFALWGGVANLGVMGGYVESSVTFHSGPFFRYEGGAAGASASFTKDGYFVDGLFKADLLSLQLGVPLGGYTSLWTTAQTLGGVWNIGRRFDLDRWFVEPSVALIYSSTHIGRLDALAPMGVDVRFRDGQDFRGGFGARVGTTLPGFVAGRALEASLTGRVWDQFASNGGRVVDIISGGVGQGLGDYTSGAVYGEVKGNLALLTAGLGLGAYVSGGAKFNDQFTSWTARGGLAYRW